jgi:8-oxo-dGTP diphosphatase
LALFLIRHAKAGSRHRWDGDDRLRPVSAPGARQAKGLPVALEPVGGSKIRRVVSSPYVRCIETVAPLAEQLGLEVEIAEALAEGWGPDALELARRWLMDDGVAACSHGDVVPFVVRSLVPDLPDPLPNAKGCTWVLERSGKKVAARYVPPPG